MPDPRLSLYAIACMSLLLATGMVVSASSVAQTSKTSVVTPATIDIGAIGYIEPRSRIVKVSHDAGPEGARIAVIPVTTGDFVKKGDLIATLSDHDRKKAQLNIVRSEIPILKAQIKSASAVLDFARSEYKRSSALVQSSAGSLARKEKTDKDFKQAQAELEILISRLDAAYANEVLAIQELKQSEILSPMDGTILHVHTRAGERIGDDGVVDMADLTKLDILAEVYERDIVRVKTGQKAEIIAPGISDKIKGEVYEIGYMVQKNDLTDTDPLAARDRRVISVRIAITPDAVHQLTHLLRSQVDVRLLAKP